MFGYLDVEKDKLENKYGLWQSFMCALCFSTKAQFGDVPRAFISNDINFMSVLFHSVTNADVDVESKRCVSHPMRKQNVLKETDLTKKLAVANVLLTYWNLYDDVVDGAGIKKKTAFKLIAKSYRQAKDALPELDELLATRYRELREMEESNCISIDRVSHSFAMLTQDFSVLILGEQANDYVQTLSYNLGKWIYLIDALDDVKIDIKRHNYNPFVACYGIKNAKELNEKYDEIEFEMYAVLNRIAQSYNDLNLSKYTCVLSNVLFDSIRNKTKQILSRYVERT